MTELSRVLILPPVLREGSRSHAQRAYRAPRAIRHHPAWHSSFATASSLAFSRAFGIGGGISSFPPCSSWTHLPATAPHSLGALILRSARSVRGSTTRNATRHRPSADLAGLRRRPTSARSRCRASTHRGQARLRTSLAVSVGSCHGVPIPCSVEKQFRGDAIFTTQGRCSSRIRDARAPRLLPPRPRAFRSAVRSSIRLSGSIRYPRDRFLRRHSSYPHRARIVPRGRLEQIGREDRGHHSSYPRFGGRRLVTRCFERPTGDRSPAPGIRLSSDRLLLAALDVEAQAAQPKKTSGLDRHRVK